MVEFRVLGPVEVTVDGRPVPLAAAKPRALLALLLLERDRPIAAAFVILWNAGPTEPTAVPGMRVYVHKLEVFLDQSQKGRRQVLDVVGRASRCELNPALALGQLDYVQANRQSLLQAVAALNVPDDDAAVRVSDLFQQAIQSSISADQYYRGWLAQGKGCVPRAHPDLKAARAGDAEATRDKVRFVDAFNRLARPLNLRQWKATEF